jgi:predicted O-methyltransferase YrrM
VGTLACSCVRTPPPWLQPIRARSWNKPWNIDDASFEKKYAAVRELVDEFGANRVIIHRGTSQEAAPTFADHSLDYIYIDGDHTVAGAVADCLLWWPKLKPGGLFFGDDYVCSGQHGKSFAMTCVKDVVDTFAKVSWHANVFDLGLHQFAIWKGS